MSFLRSVNEKILQRPQQQRTEPPAISIGVLQPVVLEPRKKKILSEILRVLNRIAARLHKRENGPPICPAKLGQRITGLLLFASVDGGKNQAPSSRYERTRFAFTLVAVLPVHEGILHDLEMIVMQSTLKTSQFVFDTRANDLMVENIQPNATIN